MQLLKFRYSNPAAKDIPLPSYATPDSSGMDIRADVTGELCIPKGGFALVPTGFSVEIPTGYELQVRARSGLAAKHGVGVLNGPGTIDADYRGEIKVILFNFGNEEFIIRRGDRIAQLVLAAVTRAQITEAAEISNTSRGSGGFGHTGVE